MMVVHGAGISTRPQDVYQLGVVSWRYSIQAVRRRCEIYRAAPKHTAGLTVHHREGEGVGKPPVGQPYLYCLNVRNTPVGDNHPLSGSCPGKQVLCRDRPCSTHGDVKRKKISHGDQRAAGTQTSLKTRAKVNAGRVGPRIRQRAPKVNQLGVNLSQ